MLRYSAHELAFDVSSTALDLIRDNEIYFILLRKIPQKYVDLYYHKMIYEAFLPLAHQLVIYEHDKNHNLNNHPRAIDANDFPCKSLLYEIWPVKSVGFSYSFSRQIKNYVKEKIKQYLKKNYLSYVLFKSTINRLDVIGEPNLRLGNIAVNYQEGFNTTNRSDIFWLQNSGIDSKSIFIYYENPYAMTQFDEEQSAQEFFDMKGINQVRLWEWNAPNKNTLYDSILNIIKSVEPSNDIDNWLKKTALQLCNRSSNWSWFFEVHNINIHLDVTESGLETVYKQIALHDRDGLSIGRTRSYPVKRVGTPYYYFLNDIFFVWGNDVAERVKNQNPFLDNVIISGFPYNSNLDDSNCKNDTIDFKTKSKQTRFNLLLLDTNHSPNDGPHQLIPSTEMVSFYQAILDWVSENEDISLVIKPKKGYLVDSLPIIKNQIIELERQTERIVLIKKPWQKMPKSYLDGIDMVIGIAAFFPSAIIECVIQGARAVFYDFANLRFHEADFYQWAENKVVFPDLGKMITALKSYKNDPLSQPELGNWSKRLDELDSFRDDRGGERIGTYMRLLQDGFKEDLHRDDAIAHANGLYAEAWGADKIVRAKKSRLYES